MHGYGLYGFVPRRLYIAPMHPLYVCVNMEMGMFVRLRACVYMYLRV